LPERVYFSKKRIAARYCDHNMGDALLLLLLLHALCTCTTNRGGPLRWGRFKTCKPAGSSVSRVYNTIVDKRIAGATENLYSALPEVSCCVDNRYKVSKIVDETSRREMQIKSQVCVSWALSLHVTRARSRECIHTHTLDGLPIASVYAKKLSRSLSFALSLSVSFCRSLSLHPSLSLSSFLCLSSLSLLLLSSLALLAPLSLSLALCSVSFSFCLSLSLSLSLSFFLSFLSLALSLSLSLSVLSYFSRLLAAACFQGRMAFFTNELKPKDPAQVALLQHRHEAKIAIFYFLGFDVVTGICQYSCDLLNMVATHTHSQCYTCTHLNI